MPDPLDDLLGSEETPPTATAAAATALVVAPEPSAIRCGFCGATVTRTNGEVIEFAPKTKQLRDRELVIDDNNKTIRGLKERIGELEQACSAANAEVSRLKTELRKKDWW